MRTPCTLVVCCSQLLELLIESVLQCKLLGYYRTVSLYNIMSKRIDSHNIIATVDLVSDQFIVTTDAMVKNVARYRRLSYGVDRQLVVVC